MKNVICDGAGIKSAYTPYEYYTCIQPSVTWKVVRQHTIFHGRLAFEASSTLLIGLSFRPLIIYSRGARDFRTHQHAWVPRDRGQRATSVSPRAGAMIVGVDRTRRNRCHGLNDY